MMLIFCLVAGVSAVLIALRMGSLATEIAEESTRPDSVAGSLSPIFTPEIQYWAADIVRWSATYSLDPDMVATVMQIESCGNPVVASPAGAQGLFQVMPYHFADGENPLDPETNARRGLTFLAELMAELEGNSGLAFAGYNGGMGAATSSMDQWADETRRYFYWSTNIYREAKTAGGSPTLQEWLAAGGAILCQWAAGELDIQDLE
jgi:soluble lytic murein transglycosylase-like protein